MQRAGALLAVVVAQRRRPGSVNCCLTLSPQASRYISTPRRSQRAKRSLVYRQVGS
jgi:hypothetical protein